MNTSLIKKALFDTALVMSIPKVSIRNETILTNGNGGTETWLKMLPRPRII